MNDFEFSGRACLTAAMPSGFWGGTWIGCVWKPGSWPRNAGYVCVWSCLGGAGTRTSPALMTAGPPADVHWGARLERWSVQGGDAERGWELLRSGCIYLANTQLLLSWLSPLVTCNRKLLEAFISVHPMSMSKRMLT